MSPCRRAILLALAFALAPLSALPGAPTVGEGADEVLAAWRGEDRAALGPLAARDEPDPWRVADELLGRGEVDAATAFAASAPRPDTARLPAYVLGQRESPTDPTRRAALAAATAAGAEPDEALASLDRAAAETDVTGVRAHLSRGQVLRAQRRHEESATAFRSAADAAGRIGWLEAETLGLFECGMSRCARSDFRGALEAWKARLAIEEKRSKRQAIAATLHQIGVAHYRLGELVESLSFEERFLAMAQESGDRAGIVLALGGLGNVHSRLKDHQRALALRQRALAISEELGDSRAIAAALGNLGNSWFDLGDYAQALSCQERCLILMEESRDEAGIARTLNNLGNLHGRLGDCPKALDVLERSLRMKEREGDRAGTARTLLNIGCIHENLRDHRKAIECFETALAVAGELGDRICAATTLRNLGRVHLGTQDIRRALLCLERATAIHEALRDRAGMASLLEDVGTAHWYLADFGKAREYFQRARDLFVELGNQPGQARTLGSLGTICAAGGDFARALACFETALALFRELRDRAGEIRTLSHIGVAIEGLGDHTKALGHFREVIEKSATNADPAAVSLAHARIGGILLRGGKHAEALEHLARAGELAEISGDRRRMVLVLWETALLQHARGEHGEAVVSAQEAVSEMQVFLRGFAEDQGPAVREIFSGIFSVGVRSAIALGDANLCTFFLESERAGALVEGLRLRDALWSAVVPDALRKGESEARAAESVASWGLRRALASGGIEEVRAARARYQGARLTVLDSIGRIQREAKDAANLVYPDADPLSAIQARLAEGDVLLIYGLFPSQSMVLAISPDDERIVPLGSTAQIETACAALSLQRADVDPVPALRELKKLVIDPLRLDEAVRRVLVCPDGALSWVPFALLTGDREVCSIPSGTVYGLLRKQGERRGEGVLALGDPDPGGAAGEPVVALARGGERLPRLPGTAVEARRVGTTVLLGAQATEAALREALSSRPRWRAVHLACHGLLDPDRPMLSSLALTPSGDDDGLLTVMDIFRMKVPADIAVLSACETGKGRLYAAEGIVGLARAFMFAGTPRVLVSLWMVDDEATAVLMERFHAAFGQGRSAATALREAQAFVREHGQWKHPRFWAAWVLWGLPD